METMRVLLVDDETEFVTTLAERLNLRQIQADIATDGESALRAIQSSPPDVLVLDLKMPGMSGLDLMREARALFPDMNVILLTGHGSTKEGIEGMNMGAFDYMMKPVDIEALIRKMKDAVKS